MSFLRSSVVAAGALFFFNACSKDSTENNSSPDSGSKDSTKPNTENKDDAGKGQNGDGSEGGQNDKDPDVENDPADGGAEAPPKPGPNPPQDDSDGGSKEPPTGPTGTVCDSDKVCLAEGRVCDLKRQVCVSCLLPADCGEGALCNDGECIDVTSCQSSLQCVGGDLVCVKEPGAEDGICLECGRDEDCESDEICAGNACFLGCDTDKTCTPTGELCDLAAGHCAECVGTAGCDEDEYCDDSSCVDAVCVPGTDSCLDDDVVTCNDVGSGFNPARACGDFPCETKAGVSGCSYPPSNAPAGALNKNGDFSAGGTGWTTKRGFSTTPAMPVAGQICASGSDTLELGWPENVDDAALLELGENYTLKFRTITTQEAVNFPVSNVLAKVGAPATPFTTYGGVRSFDLENGLTENELDFEMTYPTTSAGILITIRVNRAEVCVDNIWLVPADK